MVRPPRQRGPADHDGRPSPADHDLHAFLVRSRLSVLDVLRGAAPGTRRLVVGEAATSLPVCVVGVASELPGANAVESEIRLLRQLSGRMRPRLRATVPSARGAIRVGQRLGAVLSAVPGTGAPWVQAPHEAGRPMLDWLDMLWGDSAEGVADSDLGSAACELLEARFGSAPAAQPVLRRLERARARLEGVRLPRTAGHGCLCPRHVHVRDGAVIGVDDWGLGSPEADPLRDLGGWVVAVAGEHIADVIDGEGSLGTALRDLVDSALGQLGITGTLWREVLLLAMAEAAVTGIAAHDLRAFHVLGSACRQTIDDEDGART